MNGRFRPRRPRRETPGLQLAGLAIALVMLAGCEDRDEAMTPAEMATMGSAGPATEPASGDGMTPEEMAQMAGPHAGGRDRGRAGRGARAPAEHWCQV